MKSLVRTTTFSAAAFVVACTSGTNLGRTTENPDAAGTDAADGPDTGGDRIAILPQSGSRLHASTWKTGLLDVSTGKIWDSDKEVFCQPALTEDGVRRCVPSSFPTAVVFTDARCSVPLVHVGAGACDAEPPPYAAYGDRPYCDAATVHVVRTGAEAPVPAKIYENDGVSCAELSQVPAGRFYDASPAAPEEWTRLESSTEKVTERLAITVLTGDDGSRLDAGLRLLPEDVPCSDLAVESTGGGYLRARVRCVPSTASLATSYFADPSCSTRVATIDNCKAAGAVSDFETIPGECPRSTMKLLELGRTVERSEVTQNVNQVCEPLASSYPDLYTYYVAGAPIDESHFPELVIRTRGTGRLQRTDMTSDGKTVAPLHATLYDSTAGEECFPSMFSDGKLRCVSVAATSTSYFADATCTEPLWPTYPCEPGPGEGGTRWLLTSVNGGCGPAVDSIRPIGEAYAGPVFRLNQTCEPEPNPGATLHVLGDVVPFDTFAEVELVER